MFIEETKTVKSLKAAVEAIGGSVDVHEDTLYCDAPVGYYWKATDLTNVIVHFANKSQTWLVKAVREACEDLNKGLRKCTPEETEEEDWGQARGKHSDEGDPQPSWVAPAEAPETINFHFTI